MTKPRSLALALAPGTLLAGVAGGIVFPIFPAVGKEVGLSATFIGVILGANRAMRVVCSPSIGVMADRIGAKKTLVYGLAVQIVVIGLYLAGMLGHQEGPAFLVGRLLHGVGSACVFIAASALSIEAGVGANGGATAAAVRATIVLGTPVGFVIGGLASEAIGNVKTFVLADIAVVLALILAITRVPDLHASFGKRATLRDAIAEMRDRRLLGLCGINFALNFAAGGMVLSTLEFLVDGRQFSIGGLDERGTSGILMAILSVTDAMFTTTAGRLGDRHHAHGKVAAWSLVIGAGGLGLIAIAHQVWVVGLGIALVGVSAAGLGPSTLVLVGEIVPANRRGTAAGLLQLCGDTGGMLGPLVGTAFFSKSSFGQYLLTAGLLLLFVPVARWLDHRPVSHASTSA
ncbi:MAG: MFS transporter [Kofleriaceae bacterium]